VQVLDVSHITNISHNLNCIKRNAKCVHRDTTKKSTSIQHSNWQIKLATNQFLTHHIISHYPSTHTNINKINKLRTLTQCQSPYRSLSLGRGGAGRGCLGGGGANSTAD